MACIGKALNGVPEICVGLLVSDQTDLHDILMAEDVEAALSELVYSDIGEYLVKVVLDRTVNGRNLGKIVKRGLIGQVAEYHYLELCGKSLKRHSLTDG